MKRCFGYIRVSTVKQGEGVSLEAQKEAIQAFADRNAIEIIEWFEEKVTAAKQGRPLFNTMMRQLKQGRADGLVIHKIDRSARNFADWAKIGDLQDQGVDVHFATESLDFSSRGGRLTADIQAVIAADYIRNLREETIKGIEGRLKQGLHPGNAPFGYLNNGRGKLKTPDPKRAPLIRKMFELYASGRYSIRSLQTEMALLGLTKSDGKPLSKNSVLNILDNPFYCGIIRMKSRGKTYPGIHRKLISATLFEQVQDVRAGRTTKKKTKHDYCYRGLFRCSLCGFSLIAEAQKGHVYYRCQTKTCATKTVREEQVEIELMKMFSRYRFSLENQTVLKEGLRNWIGEDKGSEERSALLELRLGNIEERETRLTDALIDRLIDQDVFNARRNALLQEKQICCEELGKSCASDKLRIDIEGFLERVKNLGFTFHNLENDGKREFIKSFTSNRSVERQNLVLEPQKWLHSLEFLRFVPTSCQTRTRT